MGATNTIVTKAVKDQEFRQRLLNNPKEAIQKEFGIEFPQGVTVQVHQNSPTIINIVLPAVEVAEERALTETELAAVAGGLLTKSTLSSPTLSTELTMTSPLLSPLPGTFSPISAGTFGSYTQCCS